MTFPDLCPLTGERCNDHCAWYNGELMNCAVSVIAASMSFDIEKRYGCSDEEDSDE